MKTSWNKILTLLMALVMVFSLAACGSSDRDDDDDDDEKEEKIESTWKTPIEESLGRIDAKYKMNAKNSYVNQFYGLGKSQLETIYKIASKNDDLKENYEDGIVETWENSLYEIAKVYGDDWELTHEIGDKNELDEDELDSLKADYLEECGDRLIEESDYILDMDKDELEDLADDMGLSTRDLEKLAKAFKELGELLKDAEVKEGYEVIAEYSFSGEKGQHESSTNYTVVEADGIWITPKTVSASKILEPLYAIGYIDSY